MLADLAKILDETNDRANKIPLDQAFTPSSELWEVILAAYRAATNDEVQLANNTLILTTPEKYFVAISAQEIPRCWAVLPYVNATRDYELKVNELAVALGFVSRASAEAKPIFSSLRKENWRELIDKDPNNVMSEIIEDAIKTKLNLTDEEQDYFKKFLHDEKWSGVSKTLDRNDWRFAAIQRAGGWLAVAAARRGELADSLSKSLEFDRLMLTSVNEVENSNSYTLITNKFGRNVIYYGAPGTGKSRKVSELVSGTHVVRTVFHPDTQNSDFFGCLKPEMQGDKVVYRFAPGPFSKILRMALLDPNNQYSLVIEELNRAPAAAVFGELFQLLDRGDLGAGTYKIDFPSNESQAWFNEKGISFEKLEMPSNLSIYATMNSADQGVYPLDTAFRRRWEQEYFPLYQGMGPNGLLVFNAPDTYQVQWRNFVECLNNFLTDNFNVAEDRLLGLWFLKEKELGGAIPQKILLYLWDDILRHEGRDKLFASHLNTYGKVDQALSKKNIIFSDKFIALLKVKASLISQVANEAQAASTDSV